MKIILKATNGEVPPKLATIVAHVESQINLNQDCGEIYYSFIEQIKSGDERIYNKFAELVNNGRINSWLRPPKNQIELLDSIFTVIGCAYPNIKIETSEGATASPTQETLAIFQSIASEGIIPARRVLESNAPLMQASNEGRILEVACFNYLKLQTLESSKIKPAFKLLRDHSAIGWLQIALERTQLTECSTLEALSSEVQSRIMATALFLCRAPETIPPGYDSSISSNTFFKEIRHPSGLPSSDILAVFVPEHLYTDASEMFGEKAICVPLITHDLTLSAQTLVQAIRHQAPKQCSLSNIQTPDYLKALTDYIFTHQLTSFMLHIAKLPYTSRYATQLSHVSNPKDLSTDVLQQCFLSYIRFSQTAPKTMKFTPAKGALPIDWERLSSFYLPQTSVDTLSTPLRSLRDVTTISEPKADATDKRLAKALRKSLGF